MDQIQNGWFSEINSLWPGQALSLKIDKVLHEEKSEFQEIKVLQTSNHGRALILDNIIQCTESDEFAYQEMIAFLPLCAHPHPRRVLIVGGGDGGVAREAARHPLVESITQIEIDAAVIAASRAHLPFMAAGFASPKLELVVGDGFEYMRRAGAARFDVVITDSSDPVGPAASLFTEPYFALLRGALRAGGVACSQGGSPWTGLAHVRGTLAACRRHFGNVRYATASVPTYPSGLIGFVVASRAEGDLARPANSLGPVEDDLRFYNAEVHSAAFVLPSFVRRALFE